MFERYSDRARRIVSLAREEAIGLRHSYIGTEHLLLGLLREGTGTIAALLVDRQVDPEAVRSWVAGSIEVDESVEVSGQLPFTPRAENALSQAIDEAERLGSPAVGAEHLLLALLQETDGVATQVLCDSGVVVEEFRRLVEERLAANDLTGGLEDLDESPGRSDEVVELYAAAGLPIPPSVVEFLDKRQRVGRLSAEIERIKASKWQAVEEELYERAARLKDDLDRLTDERDRLAREVADPPSGPTAEILVLTQNRRIIELLEAILERLGDRP